jgi:hypothetical protein
MASLASEVSGTQMVEFFGRFGRFGGDRSKLQKLLGNDEVMKRWVASLDEFPEFRLIHGVFSTTVDVLAAFKARCAAKGIDFGRFTWVGRNGDNHSEHAPEFDSNDPETVVVLDATLETLQNTFEFAWEWTIDGQDDKWRWDGMISDQKKLRLLSDDRPDDAEGDGPDFKPWTLSWKRIKLDTNVGSKPIDVRDPKSSPGCALLFMSAEHPARIKATDYKTRYGFWLPGLKCTSPGVKRWQYVPFVLFNRDHRQVRLHSDPHDNSGGILSVPSFRE